MGENDFNVNSIISLCETFFISLGLFSIAIVKLLSYCHKKKINRDEIKLLKSQASFNNLIAIERKKEIEDSFSV